MTEFKDRLKEALNMRNMKPVELVNLTGITKSRISQFLSGYSSTKPETIKLLARALNVREAWLLGLDDNIECLKKKDSYNQNKERLMNIVDDLNDIAIQKIISYAEDLKISGKYYKD